MIGKVSNQMGFSSKKKVFEKSESELMHLKKYLTRKADAFAKKNKRKQQRGQKHLLSQLPTHDTFVAERLASN